MLSPLTIILAALWLLMGLQFGVLLGVLVTVRAAVRRNQLAPEDVEIVFGAHATPALWLHRASQRIGGWQ